MNLPERAIGTGAPARPDSGFTLHDGIDIFWRRKWLLVTFLLTGLLIGYVAYYFLPPYYSSSTLILVDPPKVPPTYVHTTVPGTINDRLKTISQQIMSRTNLSRIIKDYNLYKPEDEARAKDDGLLGKLRNKAQRLLAKYGFSRDGVATSPNQDEVPEGIIARMRKDIAVKVIGKDAFSVTYTGKDPGTVMRVTNTLALLFIEENLKARERQAEGTSEFLESQLAEAERALQKQERELREFQQQHRGALPAQLETNLRTLDRLQQEMNSIHESIQKAELTLAESQKNVMQQRALLQQEAKSTPSTQPTAGPVVRRPQASQTRVETLQQELARLRATFNENYPDVIVLKKQIEELSQSAAGAQPAPLDTARAPASEASAEWTASEPPTSATLSPTSPTVTPSNEGRTARAGANQEAMAQRATREKTLTQLQKLEETVFVAERDLAVLRARREKVIEQMRKLEEAVNATPAHEEKLAVLTRDHSISLKSYQNLLEKRLQAKISENLEKKQKGEQFRIVDPAHFPTEPALPPHFLLAGIGGALGTGLGAGLILLLHLINPALRKSEDVYDAFGIPVLAAIPRYDTDFGKHYHLVVLQEPESFIAEQYRILYTKLNDLSKEKSHKIFAITSALQNEGKTVTALNLAVVMAKDFGKKTLVLEGDFRRPSIPRYLKSELEEGLVDILSSKADMHTTMVPVANTLIPFADDNLTVLPAVRRTQNSSSLLSSPRMRDLFDLLRDQYDFILIDSPPVLPLSDMNIFEEVVDGIVLVVRAESTPRGAVERALEALGTEKVLGIVLNDVRETLSSYYKYGYKYSYRYKADEK